MSDTTALLRVQGLHVNVHGRSILQDVNFAVHAGQTLGIVGESGSGKSMTAMALMGLLPNGARLQGSICLQGQELAAQTEKQWLAVRGDRIAMVFQEPMTALNPVHTIGAQVAEPLRLHRGMRRRDALARAAQLLERVGIARARERLGAYPHEFSGGQRQRITIAMALACEPALLIADEPTTALDVIVQQHILDLLDVLVREQQMGLVLISHDLAVISSYSDHVAVMTQGRIVEQGATDAVFTAPQHAYTQELLASRKRLMAFAEPQQAPSDATDGAGATP
ncbi:ATP-binding cassette domain-containing protein [Lampropedia cohaerens]|uniref:ATP-binding cassette domain-containing protein n=1 Tax=Lampropedia cohaerens TaxID=1610491 RepID=UPI00069BF175|nr:ABC transporter ATP-binding protein [Lampropedia cohaerens]